MGYPTYIERFTGKVIPIYPLGTKVMTNGAVVGKIIEVDIERKKYVIQWPLQKTDWNFKSLYGHILLGNKRILSSEHFDEGMFVI